jgi:3'-phosphoadenosine 5'-phosphosulfate sulfotransferase (PAPS reductase)/FAD synthetase
MKNYLSFGGGVNSVAMQLILQDEGVDFESIFVNHGADWPETYEYFDYFQDWLASNGFPEITVLKPDVGTIEGNRFDNLYDYYHFKKVLPSRRIRSCTDKMKKTPFNKYTETPCFVFIGYSSNEKNRARMTSKGGREYRWPLIEREINREACKRIIKNHGLKLPMKSGCFCCPFQRRDQFQDLRRKHPELFCRVEQLETGQLRKQKLKISHLIKKSGFI